MIVCSSQTLPMRLFQFCSLFKARRRHVIGTVLAIISLASPAAAQAVINGKEFYTQVHAFSLSGGTASVHDLRLNRDRVEMTFNGTFYFAASVDGHVTGAVFIGNGNFNAPVPPSDFEKENVKRLLGTEAGVESDFHTAVLRFSDDTFEQLGQKPQPSTPDATAQKLATETEARVLKETGANLSARISLSILNQEKPGFFFGIFDGGKRGRFSYILDYQTRLPVVNFDLNGGEKGLICHYQTDISNPEIWLAFYAQEDYARGSVAYADVNDQIDITHYDLDVDLIIQDRKSTRL